MTINTILYTIICCGIAILLTLLIFVILLEIESKKIKGGKNDSYARRCNKDNW